MDVQITMVWLHACTKIFKFESFIRIAFMKLFFQIETYMCSCRRARDELILLLHFSCSSSLEGGCYLLLKCSRKVCFSQWCSEFSKLNQCRSVRIVLCHTDMRMSTVDNMHSHILVVEMRRRKLASLFVLRLTTNSINICTNLSHRLYNNILYEF